jgi:hypothetical protein
MGIDKRMGAATAVAKVLAPPVMGSASGVRELPGRSLRGAAPLLPVQHG